MLPQQSFSHRYVKHDFTKILPYIKLHYIKGGRNDLRGILNAVVSTLMLQPSIVQQSRK